MKQLWHRLPLWRRRTFVRVFSLTAGLGLLAFGTRLGQSLDDFAFDLLTVIRSSRPVADVAVVGIDDASLRELQAPNSAVLPRRHHANLLRRLAAEKAKGAVFDIFFEQDGPSAEEDAEFAQSMREFGACILSAYTSGTGASQSIMAPIRLFREAARAWGLSHLDASQVVRRIWQHPGGTNSIAEAALWAFNGNSSNGRLPAAGTGWLCYLGPPGSPGIQVYRYADLTNLPPGTFTGKVVFVGRTAAIVPVTSLAGPDSFLTPYHLLGRGREAGVILHALTYINLRDKLWLKRMPPPGEVLVLGVLALSFAALASLVSFRKGLAGIVVLAGLAMASALATTQWFRVWWGFMVPLALEAPVAVAAGWLMRTRRVAVEQENYDAFISYRREDGATLARLIRSELARRGYRAFLDVEDIGAVRFDESLLQTIARVPVVIVILSPKCLDRCTDPSDWVRREIQHAFQNSRFIIPLMTPDFRFPEGTALPDDLRMLPTLNCIQYSHQHFGATIDQLVTAMGRRTNVVQDR